MFYRKIKPENGYCLYFPNRKQGARFEAGRRIRVWLWEEWKHIKLGQFEVKFEKELVSTADNLDCEVRADFQIVVGGPEDGRESRLEKATISCSPTKNIKDKIELEFFKVWATNYCKSSVVRVIQKCNYVNLIEDLDYRTDAANRIEDDARKTLENIGLILVRCTVVLEPLEPKSILATKDILDKWLEFRRTLDAANLAKQQAENQKKQQEAELEREHSEKLKQTDHLKKTKEKEIDDQTKIKIAEIEANTAIKEKEQERDRDEVVGQIDEVIYARAQQSQLQKIRMAAQIEEEREKKRADLEKEREKNNEELARLKRQNEEQRLQHELKRQQLELEKLEKEREAKQREVEVVELKRQIAEKENTQEEQRGMTKVKIIKEETLAKSADVIEMRKLLMDNLPKVMEMANRPIEKMGEIRINMYGGGADTVFGQNNTLGTFLASASTLPIIKEFLRFLKDWEGETSEVKTVLNGQTPIKEARKVKSESE